MAQINYQEVDAILANFAFESDCHQRYENNNPVMGLQECPRYLEVKKNVNGCDGYLLIPGDGYILYATNGETGRPQFSPKPMRVKKATDSEILLQGFDLFAKSPFGLQEIDLSDYGFSIFLQNGKPKKCVLYMYDRNIKIEYRKINRQPNVLNDNVEITETEQLVIEAMRQFNLGNDGDETYHPLYKAWCSFRGKPTQLRKIQNYGQFGMALEIFLSYDQIRNMDDQRQIASIAYLFISKAIKNDPRNVNLYKNRLLTMVLNHNTLHDTVSYALNNYDGLKSLCKMELADFQVSPQLLNVEILSDHFRNLRSQLSSGYFGNNESFQSIKESGKKIHEEVLSFLEEKVFILQDIDFDPLFY